MPRHPDTTIRSRGDAMVAGYNTDSDNSAAAERMLDENLAKFHSASDAAFAAVADEVGNKRAQTK